jgi:hypothetical protein
MIENVHATNSIFTSVLAGLPGFDIEDVTLSNIRIDSDEGGKAEWVKREIPELPKAYPNAKGFGRLPAYGVYSRHVTGLRLRDIEFRSAANESRPAIFCEDVKNLEVDGLRSLLTSGTQPVIKLVQTKQALVRGCSAPAGTKAFLEVTGDKSDQILLMGSNLLGAEQAVQTGAEVTANGVTVSGNVSKL